jgi:hypothetical protein
VVVAIATTSPGIVFDEPNNRFPSGSRSPPSSGHRQRLIRNMLMTTGLPLATSSNMNKVISSTVKNNLIRPILSEVYLDWRISRSRRLTVDKK